MSFHISKTCAYKCATKKTKEALDSLRNFWGSHGAEPIDERRHTLLHLLAIEGNVDAFKELFEHGLVSSYQVKKRNDNGDTALHEAARNDGATALHLLAKTPSSFRSGSSYVLRNLGTRPFIPLHILVVIVYSCIPANFIVSEVPDQDLEDSDSDGERLRLSKIKRSFWVRKVLGLPGIKHIDAEKQKHILALELAKRLIKLDNCYIHSRTDSPESIVKNPLLHAIKHGIDELALEILEKYPNAASSFGENGKNIMHMAVEHKCANLYKLLKNTVICKYSMLNDIDCQGNTIVHLATNTRDVPNFPLGVMHQMAWDVFWFKRVKRDCSPHLFHLQNVEVKWHRRYRNAANSVDEKGRNIMHIAVEHKCSDLYEHLKRTIVSKDSLMADIDHEGNTIFCLAANEGHLPNFPLGVLNQMTWDVFCLEHYAFIFRSFTFVRDSHAHLLNLHNFCGKIAELLENHSHLWKVAEKTSKDVNQGLMVVFTLIGTVSFVALFTVHGGFDQNNGHPILLDNHKQLDLQTFILYAGGTLFSSLLSLGTLLLIQLSPFHIENFYFALPTQYHVVAFALFCSTFFSITLCSQSFILEDVVQTGYIATLFMCIMTMVCIYADALLIAARYTIQLWLFVLASKHHEM
ncbi:hypothetical protein RJ639_003051 [Escallonia herrerae]|uniref:PGG domain-containing protein n=1 Tax=Escallonia herrerae TaxID=1293975 RepID=A0AA88W2U9_9ASTE|nr:hypothetical protein RJ639_003051 [Escallonia herrerae]